MSATPAAIAHNRLLAEASATGYSANLKWCLRCDVGWGGLGVTECWLCEQNDEVYCWRYDSGGPKMERVTP